MKTTIKPYPYLFPCPIVVIGTVLEGTTNFTTIGDIAVAGLHPPLLMVSLHEEHNATKAIRKSNRFSVNIPTIDMLSQVDFAGMYSSKKVDKSALFSHTFHQYLPIIDASPISMIVEVKKYVQIKQRVICICEVQETLLEDQLFHSGKLDFESIQPILYGLDNFYYSHLSKVGKGYHEGKQIRTSISI